MFGRKGFTLIEILGVIILLGVLSAVIYPIINKNVNESRQKAYDESIAGIERAAYLYSVEIELGLNSSYSVLELSLLQEEGLLKKTDLINPINNERFDGCVLYRWNNRQYEFEYADSAKCEEIKKDNNQ